MQQVYYKLRPGKTVTARQCMPEAADTDQQAARGGQSLQAQRELSMLRVQEATDTASRLHVELQATRQQVQKLQSTADAAKQASAQQVADIQVRGILAVAAQHAVALPCVLQYRAEGFTRSRCSIGS